MRRPGGATRRVPPGLAWAAILALGAACAGVRPWAFDESHRIGEAMRGPAFEADGREGTGIALGPAPPLAPPLPPSARPPTHRRRPGRPRPPPAPRPEQVKLPRR